MKRVQNPNKIMNTFLFAYYKFFYSQNKQNVPLHYRKITISPKLTITKLTNHLLCSSPQVSSDSSIFASDTHFASYTSNELRIARQRGEDLIIYESYSLTLATIDPAEAGLPMTIVDPASASVYAFQYIDDDEESAEMVKRAKAMRPAKLSVAKTARGL